VFFFFPADGYKISHHSI